MLHSIPSLPKLPGVYLFKNEEGQVLYIGKAKNLATRVASYFSLVGVFHEKLASLMQEASSVEHIVTHSEQDALLLEEHLIKLYQPLYNVLLTSGEPFLYLVVTEGPVPELKVARSQEVPGVYFGPFTHRRVVRRAYDYLMKRFRLYRCSVAMPNGCLRYHLGICAGVCTGSFDVEAYRMRLMLAQQVLKGDTQAFRETLQEAVTACNAKLNFEEARQLHTYAEDLDAIFHAIEVTYGPGRYRHEVAHAVAKSSVGSEQPHALYDEAEHELRTLLGIESEINSIDCFDISHTQGRFIVGSCIRFTRGVPDRKKFRRFRITSLDDQNDYAALQEIVERRYKKGVDIPDLLLIDGGKGQLSSVKSVIPRAHVVALAKREERLFGTLKPEGVILDVATPLGKLLIALRDYAHRFALQYHTLLMKKGIHGTKKT